MTPHQWTEVITQITQLWGHSQKWRDATNLYNRIANIPQRTMYDIINDLTRTGRPTTPAPAEIIGLAHQRHGTNQPTERPHPDNCNHPTMGILAYDPLAYICAICLYEWAPNPVPLP